jgi:hypothetical protein
MSADYARIQRNRTPGQRGDMLRDLVQDVVRYCIEPFQAAVTEHWLDADSEFEHAMDVVIADAPAVDSPSAVRTTAGFTWRSR